MPRQVPAKRISRRDALDCLAKAAEFISAAEECVALRLFSPAVSNAVHAGINACDAMSGLRSGLRSTGQDHRQAIALLRQIRPEGAETAPHLTALLSMKPMAEYDPKPMTKNDAKRAVRRARALMALAERVAGRH